MVSESEAADNLREALTFIQDSPRTRDFVIARASTVDSGDEEEEKTYDVGEIPFHSNIHNALLDIVVGKIQSQLEAAVEGDSKGFEQYDIGNVNKDVEPLQFLSKTDLPHFDRFQDLVEEPEFPETSFDSERPPEFQVIRVKNSDGDMVVAFQKYSNRQILGRNWKVKVPLGEGNEYNQFEDNLMAVPERIDALFYDGILYVLDHSKFEDIFDYMEAYENKAAAVFEGLEETDIHIHDFDRFAESIRGDHRALRKMRQVKERGLYHDLERSEVEEIVEEFDLGIEIAHDDDGRWGIEVPDLRKKWDVIRLLNDDHLYSALTEARYQARGKDER